VSRSTAIDHHLQSERNDIRHTSVDDLKDHFHVWIMRRANPPLDHPETTFNARAREETSTHLRAT